MIREWVLVDGVFCRECSGPVETPRYPEGKGRLYRCLRCAHLWWVT